MNEKELRKQIRELKKENEILKTKLDMAYISINKVQNKIKKRIEELEIKKEKYTREINKILK